MNRRTFLMSSSAFFVAGCAGSTGAGDEQIADEFADEILVEADTPAERALRLDAIVAIAHELAADRVTLYMPERAADVLGRLIVLQDLLQRFHDQKAIWLNTRIYDVARQVILMVRAAGRERLFAILQPGISLAQVWSLLDRAKGLRMREDVQIMFARIEAGDLSEEEARQAIADLIKWNTNRVQSLAGG